ncbi:MAG: glycerol-3-phosphate 1-O-acyltransferase PlsY [bacterium]|nr:glycerol-3-phosphate 1-O-acyltransferase PlsY [bacterium]
MITAIAVLALAFLIGGIPFGLLVAKAYGIRDLRAQGSGNIGATNVWRVAGAKAALWVYLLDIGKGVVAVLIARLIDQSAMPRDWYLVLAALLVVLGHIFSPYLRFKGGKGVNTGLGVMLVLMPVEVLISLGVFVIVVSLTRYISLGSIIASLTLVTVALIERLALVREISFVYIGLTILLALAIILTHRTNIRRLIEGTESKFSLSSKGRG